MEHTCIKWSQSIILGCVYRTCIDAYPNWCPTARVSPPPPPPFSPSPCPSPSLVSPCHPFIIIGSGCSDLQLTNFSFVFSDTWFTLCCDTLTIACWWLVIVSMWAWLLWFMLACHNYIAVMLRPQNLHIHVPQDFWGKEQLEYRLHTRPFLFVMGWVGGGGGGVLWAGTHPRPPPYVNHISDTIFCVGFFNK